MTQPVKLKIKPATNRFLTDKIRFIKRTFNGQGIKETKSRREDTPCKQERNPQNEDSVRKQTKERGQEEPREKKTAKS